MAKKPGILTRADILAASDLKTKTVTVPEWGGQVTVTELTGAQREVFEGFYFDVAAKNVVARLMVMTVIDADGNLVFSDDDIDSLSQKAAAPLKQVFDAALELNALGATAIEAATEN